MIIFKYLSFYLLIACCLYGNEISKGLPYGATICEGARAKI